MSMYYEWLGTDLTQNILGHYIPILPTVLITLTSMVLMTGPKLVSHYPPSVWRLTQSLYDRTFSTSVLHLNTMISV